MFLLISKTLWPSSIFKISRSVFRSATQWGKEPTITITLPVLLSKNVTVYCKDGTFLTFYALLHPILACAAELSCNLGWSWRIFSRGSIYLTIILPFPPIPSARDNRRLLVGTALARQDETLARAISYPNPTPPWSNIKRNPLYLLQNILLK